MKTHNGIGFAAWVVDDDAQRAKATGQMKKEMDSVINLPRDASLLWLQKSPAS